MQRYDYRGGLSARYSVRTCLDDHSVSSAGYFLCFSSMIECRRKPSDNQSQGADKPEGILDEMKLEMCTITAAKGETGGDKGSGRGFCEFLRVARRCFFVCCPMVVYHCILCSCFESYLK
eukprot:GHVU01000826.1.p1 GENE.GHVU01000826.1~~GHVU01000826.1.p1  ORF type:complete len:120 (-),score=6.66 GHVU01000826.1:47-406(-)